MSIYIELRKYKFSNFIQVFNRSEKNKKPSGSIVYVRGTLLTTEPSLRAHHHKTTRTRRSFSTPSWPGACANQHVCRTHRSFCASVIVWFGYTIHRAYLYSHVWSTVEYEKCVCVYVPNSPTTTVNNIFKVVHLHLNYRKKIFFVKTKL
ncbi:PREDICTED: uncharacterized protein LOC108761140 [Trachymyrmex cornetzi]|uniref:uncharacterized protein LOC108761140 n=1 Tax=Trachymyrmex cornetzi TaxID=471704 RepID=UPI00084F1864|nr:PREDICTED: uncharacterized protein LOC108761140 [Trachymyrmex cornetzi]